MNILFIPAHDFYRKNREKGYYNMLMNCAKKSKHKIHIHWTDKDPSRTPNINYDLIVFFDIDTLRSYNKFSFLKSKGVPMCAACIDFFWFDNCVKDKGIQNMDVIIFLQKATKLIASYQKVFPEKHITNIQSRYIDTNTFKNYGLEKIYDIVIYGSRDGRVQLQNHDVDIEYITKYKEKTGVSLKDKHYFYPLRVRLEELLLRNMDKYRVKIIDQVGSINSKINGVALSKILNQSYLTIVTCSRADILMKKYLEAVASHSGLLGNIPSDYRNLFENNMVEVDEFMTDDEILSRIDEFLNDKTSAIKKIDYLHEQIHKYHSFDNAVEDFDDVFEKLVK